VAREHGGNHETLRNWVEQPYPVRLLCRVLQVSTSAFYDWIHRGRPAISDTDLDDAYDANQLRDAWAAHRRTYGARRLTAEIRDRGQAWNRKKVARLMTRRSRRFVTRRCAGGRARSSRSASGVRYHVTRQRHLCAVSRDITACPRQDSNLRPAV
jgi:putative transposase